MARSGPSVYERWRPLDLPTRGACSGTVYQSNGDREAEREQER